MIPAWSEIDRRLSINDWYNFVQRVERHRRDNDRVLNIGLLLGLIVTCNFLLIVAIV